VTAEVPKKINYQGKITDSDSGVPLSGTHGVVFRIFDTETGGVALWSEAQSVTPDSAGVFSTILGSVAVIDLAFDGPMWLEIEVEGETLSPRREMVSVPFSFTAGEAGHASDADSLGGVGPDSYALVGHVHAEYIARDEAGSVTGEMITNGGITDEDVASDAAIAPDKIAGGAWTSENDGSGSGMDADTVDGLHADAFSDTAHSHSDTYFAKYELHNEGTLNSPENPVHWTKLTGVPEGFADGLDDVGGAGDGHSLDADDGDPADAVYVDSEGKVGIGLLSPGAELDVAGGVNSGSVYQIGGETVLSVSGVSNVMVGSVAGVNNSGSFCALVGDSAGYNNEGLYSTHVGHSAGYSNRGTVNTFVGANAGRSNGLSTDNTFVGAFAGATNNAGHTNTFLGSNTGYMNDVGSNNTFLGAAAGFSNALGHSNTFVGKWAGFNTSGSRNVFIGNEAGYNETGSDRLYIANGPDADDVLIYGEFSTGNLGIGTLDPARTLHVSSSFSNFGMVQIENSTSGDNEASIGFKEGSDADGSEIWVAGVGGWGNTNDFVIGRAATKLLITPGGRVGAGTLGPTAMFDGNAATGVGVKGRSGDDDGVVGRTEVSGKSGVYGHSDDGFGVTGRSDNNFAVAAIGGGDASGYDDMGDLLLGGTYGEIFHFGTMLNVYANGGIGMFLDHDDNMTHASFGVFEGGGALIFDVDEEGDVQISGDVELGPVSVPGHRLFVAGTSYCTGGWQTSDRRFKRDVEDIDDALSKVLGLRGVSFTWKTDEYVEKGFPGGRHYGVIAQEVEEVLPEVVGGTPGEERTVAYSEIIPVLVEAMKTQQGEIEALRAEIIELRSALK
jgi:hypothetical protein